MKKPEKFTKTQGVTTLEAECQVTIVELSMHYPTGWASEAAATYLGLTAQDCLVLADMLRESATYILRNKHEKNT